MDRFNFNDFKEITMEQFNNGKEREMPVVRITRPIDPDDLGFKKDELVLRRKCQYSKYRLARQVEFQKLQEPERPHFSHGHPLRRCQVQLKDAVICSGCELELSGTAYGCTKCGFFLHKSCFELPQRIRHRSHPRHDLNLISSSPYQGTFICKACGDHGSGFDFNCATCKYDLHVDCAYLPKTLGCDDHEHNLTLYYTIPFDLKNVDIEACDICAMPISSDRWGFYCLDCDYAAHLECAKAKEKK